MAMSNEWASDALLLLRRSIAVGNLPVLSTTAEPTVESVTGASLAEASYAIFSTIDDNTVERRVPIPITTLTRFVSVAAGRQPLDLRSVLFCWLNKDAGIGDYISATQELNKSLRTHEENQDVVNLVFAEKLDLVTWLAGEIGIEDSEYIQRDSNVEQRTSQDASYPLNPNGDVQDPVMDDITKVVTKPDRSNGDRLFHVYRKERKMASRNSMLHGVKAQDFGDIRQKYSVLFFGRTRQGNNTVQADPSAAQKASSISRSSTKSQSGRRPEPIILISPSASSLLRLPNIKSFLEDGRYSEPDSGSSVNMLHLMRTLPAISVKPIRFIIVDDPSSFRPDYWDRLVAVFTTGQTWQFKNYKWSQPAQLFEHALGVYVGFKGEVVPEAVKGWGRGVLSVQIDQGPNRWRDREVVEDVWRGIEVHMKTMGWGKGSK